MKVIATLQADLEMTPLGTRSRLVDDLHGIPVLRRTVEGLRRTKLLQGVYVLSPAEQAQRCVSLLGGTGAVVRPFDAPPPPWASLVPSLAEPSPTIPVACVQRKASYPGSSDLP